MPVLRRRRCAAAVLDAATPDVGPRYGGTDASTVLEELS
jgi:hypothetical protein